jgi:hypothetical protein
MSSGWADAFLQLAERFARAIEELSPFSAIG